METITPQSMREWRKNSDLTQEKLGSMMGLDKIAISKIEGGLRKISPSEQILLNLIMFGNFPFLNNSTKLEFSGGEWAIIHRMAQREGYADGRSWIVAKIRAYLAQLPKTEDVLMVAESAAEYKKQNNSISGGKSA